ncbi:MULTISPECIES: BON domain-containing protein [unclassified Cupriavidus]|uniref:BON domain-containing protein n=1 Tax=unclassified Cupriavidus TaxID=2640874 RepID=UPI001C00656F|nr:MULTISPECIES: BON domain-containing protein [unclassified Cupriavidus]MCA3185483.1 BON domain-containing protein [Cupriavidus sp.]MCA3192324.1 BON domain-containing protein [Cupriavidus sp.]MCA3196099.1 BON domain-containing protein [Cupriavidus sp.]MCA3203632.1 BON domain-containing protein [Cupriavidus sp.]MCA3206282.1 BON domain-containing protein [Cupriavidus sp.]
MNRGSRQGGDQDDRYQDDRYQDDRRGAPRDYGGDPRQMERTRYTGQAGWGIGHGYPGEAADREDGSGAYRHGGMPGEHRWRGGYGAARGSGVDSRALPGAYGDGPGGSERSGAQGHRQQASPKGYTRSDDRIREDLCERLAHAGRLDVREVEVTVSEGWVTLSGTVPARPQKYRIEDIAASVYGVKDVENRIRVLPGSGDTRWAAQSSEPGLTGQLGRAGQTASQNVGEGAGQSVDAGTSAGRDPA